jgi:hypothetical protein
MKNLKKPICAILFICTCLFIAACQQDESNFIAPDASVSANGIADISSQTNVVNLYPAISDITSWELQQARAATARYRDLKNAKKDGYSNINVVVENMGYHYMKSEYVDATFDVRKPEILVYAQHDDGSYELVAVEYAVPLTLSANAPEGFSGSMDVWDENQGFGLWLLHAWVWSYNPDGVFHSTNPLVHLH